MKEFNITDWKHGKVKPHKFSLRNGIWLVMSESKTIQFNSLTSSEAKFICDAINEKIEREELGVVIETEIGEVPVRKFFKECLEEVLISNPPKRFLGDSGWWHTLALGLAQANIITGKIMPCCEEVCEGQTAPCTYEYKGESGQVDEGLRRLINLL